MATPSSTGINWSQIAAPPKQQQSRSTKPPSPSQTQSRSTKNRKNRKKRQKQGKQQWPTLNGNNNNKNQSQSNNNTNGSVSFAALTSKSRKFAPTSNRYDTLSMSSAPSYHANNTHNNQISKQELDRQKAIRIKLEQQTIKIEQQRQSALNTLKKQYIDNEKDIFCSNNIYGVRNRGICNRNVDCYINAIIQTILSLPLVITIFSSIKNPKTAANIGPFTKTLYDIMHLFNISSQHSHKSRHKNKKSSNHKKQLDSINYNHTNYSKINHPKSLISILDKFRHSIGRMGHGQQDAHEFLGWIVANLHDEMVWNKKDTNESTQSLSLSKKTSKQTENSKNDNNSAPGKHSKSRKQRKALREQQQQNKNENHAELQRREEKKEGNMDHGWKLVTKNIHRKTSVAHKLKMNESLISMLFGGEYYQIIRSQRKSKKMRPSVGYQPFFSVSLDINENKIKTVSSALQHHFSKPHVISYKNGYANKSELISEAPYYLILHLKRFLFEDGQVYKLNKYIGYDTKLTVAQHLLFDKSTMKTPINANKLRYELRSVIVHEGDFVTHGHYISYCRREDFYINKINKNRTHQWILFNDDRVKGPIHINTLKSQQAYVLIYQKCYNTI